MLGFRGLFFDRHRSLHIFLGSDLLVILIDGRSLCWLRLRLLLGGLRFLNGGLSLHNLWFFLRFFLGDGCRIVVIFLFRRCFGLNSDWGLLGGGGLLRSCGLLGRCLLLLFLRFLR